MADQTIQKLACGVTRMAKLRSWFATVIGVFFVVLSVAGGQTWQAPTLLNGTATSDTSEDDTDPRIETDGDGNWIAVWQSRNTLGGSLGGDFDILVARSADNGASWTAPVELNSNADSDSGDDLYPILAFDGMGTWIAMWQSKDTAGGGLDWDIYSAVSVDSGQTWSARVAVNSSSGLTTGFDSGPRVATDGAGTWIAVWSSSEETGGLGPDFDILVARSTDNGGSWSTSSPANANADSDTEDDYSPQVATDGAGNWVLVWGSNSDLGGTIGTDPDILFARSEDLGVTWSGPTPLGTNMSIDSGEDYYAQIATDGFGNWLAGWYSDDSLGGTIGTDFDVLVSRSSDAGITWTSPSALAPEAATDTSEGEYDLNFTADAAGNWVATYETCGGFGSDCDIVFSRSTDAGASWSSMAPLAAFAVGDSGEDYYPHVATDRKGTFVVAWQSTEDFAGAGTDWDSLVATGTICSDGFIAGPEECDDGNLFTGDGCDADCLVESGFSCDPTCFEDHPIDAKKLIVKRSGSGKEKIVFLSKDPLFAFPPIGGDDDPSIAGMTVELISATEGIVSFDVPSGSNWKVRDSTKDFYKFVNTDAPDPPSEIKTALLADGKLVKLISKSTGLSLAAPQGSVAVRITTGSIRSCALFSASTADIKRDEVDRFIAKAALGASLSDCSDASLMAP